MPRAHTHRAVALFGAVILAAGGALTYGTRIAAVAAVACVFGELWMSADRDLDNGARSWRWWFTFGFVWALYAALIPHRSKLSHWPVVGVAGRVLYVAVPVVGVLCLAGMDGDVVRFVSLHHVELAAAYVGLEASGTLHWVADRMP